MAQRLIDPRMTRFQLRHATIDDERTTGEILAPAQIEHLMQTLVFQRGEPLLAAIDELIETRGERISRLRSCAGRRTCEQCSTTCTRKDFASTKRGGSSWRRGSDPFALDRTVQEGLSRGQRPVLGATLLTTMIGSPGESSADVKRPAQRIITGRVAGHAG